MIKIGSRIQPHKLFYMFKYFFSNLLNLNIINKNFISKLANLVHVS